MITNSQSHPLISILITIGPNRDTQFKMSMESLCRYDFDYLKIELVVFIDTQNSKNILKILKKIKKNFCMVTVFVATNKKHVICHNATRRNFLATQARGEWLLFTEPEMYHFNDTLQRFLQYADKKFERFWIYGSVFTTSALDREFKALSPKEYINQENIEFLSNIIKKTETQLTNHLFNKYFFEVDISTHPPFFCIMLNKKIFFRLKGLNQKLLVRGWEEYDLFNRFQSIGGQLLHISKCTTAHIPHKRGLALDNEIGWNLFNMNVAFDESQQIGQMLDVTYKKMTL